MKITVRVKTRSSSLRLVKGPDRNFTAYLTSAPVKGKANRQLLDLLSKEFNIARSLINIKQGKRSRIKVVHIGG